jgi:ribosomal protein S18 acetylase RimI-like enzyme
VTPDPTALPGASVPRGPEPPAGVTVSFGAAADIESLRPFWLALHHIHQGADPELAPHVDDETSWWRRRALYEHCLKSPDAFLLLLRREDDLIGYALVAVEPDGDVLWSDTWQVGGKVAELETIYVVPEERGRKLGSLLLDIVDAELDARDIHDLAIGAVPGNTAALRLYERRGFLPSWTIMTRFAARTRRERGKRDPA